jgi:hypothetical protein
MNTKYPTDINLETTLHPGEPFFLVRGQDVYSPAIISLYGTLLHANGDKLGSLQIEALAEGVRMWQKANPDLVKHPD